MGHTHTGIAYECFLDELAHKGGIDPSRYACDSLKTTAHESRAQRAQGKVWMGHRRGRVAARIYSISPVAQAVEVTVADNGDFTVDRVVCVVDAVCSQPAGCRGPGEGGLAYGLGGVAFGNIDIVNGQVQQSNFHDYPVLRLRQMPKVEVHILPSAEPPTGVGDGRPRQ